MSHNEHEFQLTKSQKIASQKINQYDLVFLEGPAGTGKSLTVLKSYLDMPNFSKKGHKIYVIRTPVEAGPDKVGFLPDKLEDKMAPHFGSTQALLKKMLGGRYDGLVKSDYPKIEFLIPNYALGHTFENALIFIDEAQQLQPSILKLLLERMGKYSKCVVAGDSSQLYLDEAQGRSRQALADATDRFFNLTRHVEGYTEMLPKYDNIAYHKFDVEDVQRSEIVKTVIRAYGNLT